jgi:hypothetical protein
MAHFAEISSDNRVIRVVVVSNEIMRDARGVESEQEGAAFCRSLYGDTPTKWVQTSYNNRIRSTYAGIGYHYDLEGDAFYHPQPYPSWKLDKTIWDWVSPVPVPEPVDGSAWIWDEPTLSWVLVEGYGTVTIPPA